MDAAPLNERHGAFCRLNLARYSIHRWRCKVNERVYPKLGGYNRDAKERSEQEQHGQ